MRDCCMRLQDEHGLNPNQLIFGIWCARAQRALDHAALAGGAAADWHQEVTGLVRQARRNAVASDAATRAVAETLRRVELDVEQVELGLLEESAAALSCPVQTTVGETVLQNLLGFDRCGGDAGLDPERQSLLEELAERCRQWLRH